MSSDRVLDYLTEELVVEKNIVTYRSLSNALGIHVNEAKNELAFYYSEHAGSFDAARATYIISGEPRVSYLDSVRDAEEMAVDDEETVEHSEDVSETKITLVGDAELENSKEQYTRIDYIHIYSLSPSPIREPAILCEPAKALREAGTGKNNDASSSVALGRITGPHVKKRTGVLPTRSSANAKPTAAASTSKSKLPGLSRAASTTTDTKPIVKSEPKDVKLGVKEELPKSKPSGKLDFSKAKPAAPKAVPGVRKTEPAEPSSMPEVASKPERKTLKPKGKPPVERKSTMKFSDSEDESPTKGATRPQELPSKRSGSKSTARVKKGVILSDEEDEEEAPKPARPKAAYKVKTERRSPDLDLDAGAESELRAMMDIDDDQVTRVSRTVTSAASESATSPPVSDVDMEDRESVPAAEPEPAPAPSRKPQRKPKKQVPVGRNGLKKRRVVKSRMKTDDKGYFVTEDYSSYESVDEEAPPPEKPAKGKGKGKKAAIVPAASKSDDEPAEEKVIKAPAKKAPTLERKPSKPNVQKGGIASYFTKK
ncbi:DNA polymerase subunit Cdc27 [Lactarius akahatsu]|uniref:DNA polymerase delta subunit 3 n=1 Tax=Lactarius akahatsu TaxID=416441 RepID=A0AAD4QD87_9AGAM|nr:DNA polymerase subunit Cdc27 [Lactarius akahatsu]